MLRWPVAPPWMSSPGWALRFSEPPSTDRNVVVTAHHAPARGVERRPVELVVARAGRQRRVRLDVDLDAARALAVADRELGRVLARLACTCGVAFAVVASTVPSFVKSHAYVSVSPSASAPVPVKLTASGAGPATLSACADAVGAEFDAMPLPMNVNSSRSNRSVGLRCPAAAEREVQPAARAARAVDRDRDVLEVRPARGRHQRRGADHGAVRRRPRGRRRCRRRSPRRSGSSAGRCSPATPARSRCTRPRRCSRPCGRPRRWRPCWSACRCGRCSARPGSSSGSGAASRRRSSGDEPGAPPVSV